ncbi:transposase [Actinoplanes sp. NPDC049681]|uniref:transposase n=1 Tax=Actinoplanes sp. NPDC049681 TaxID=3363905 RepID=UPI00379DD854
MNGRKRHVLVDMFGLPIAVLVTPADIRDGAAAQVLLVDCRQDNPQLAMIWGDSAYGGDLITWAETELAITVKTVRPPPDQVGFRVHPRRWRVERSLSWITQRRRNARDYERRADYSAAHILWAFVLVMSRRSPGPALNPADADRTPDNINSRRLRFERVRIRVTVTRKRTHQAATSTLRRPDLRKSVQ